MNLDHFGFLAPFYEKFIKANPPEHLLSHIQLDHGIHILDAGGGTGRLSQFLTREDNLVFVLDSSFLMLLEASKKSGLHQVCSTTEALPFSAESFDRILIVDALHHVVDQQETVSQLINLLKPGGKLIIEEPDIRKFPVKLIALGEKILLMRSHFLDADEICAMCARSGITIRTESMENAVWVIAEKHG